VTVTDAVLVIDKPTGPTSFDVVRKIRRAAGTRHVGHGGTLDPLASGVLPVCLGEATKLAQFLLDADKEYEVTIALGAETDTDDAQGAVTVRRAAAHVTEGDLRAALAGFRGPIAQVPPVYSALKRAGRPLYDYARAGEEVAIAPRAVVVHELELVAFHDPGAVTLAVRCSKGTYVRALARDLGRALDVGGHVVALRRTRSGPFALGDARPLTDVLQALATADAGALPAVSLPDALAHLDRRIVSAEAARDLRLGRKIPWGAVGGEGPGRVCVIDPAGALVAVAEPRADGLARTLRVFGQSSAVLH
jgi:tRNA pseudouridine55 synthase